MTFRSRKRRFSSLCVFPSLFGGISERLITERSLVIAYELLSLGKETRRLMQCPPKHCCATQSLTCLCYGLRCNLGLLRAVCCCRVWFPSLVFALRIPLLMISTSSFIRRSRIEVPVAAAHTSKGGRVNYDQNQ